MITDLGHSLQRLDDDIRSGKPEKEKVDATRLGIFKGFIEQEWDRLFYEHQTGARGSHIVSQWTATVDAVITESYRMYLLEHDSEVTFSVVALGGYGRAALNPCSDVDLLFLFKEKGEEETPIVRSMLHLLWDLGFDLGHSTRTIDGAIEHAREDSTSCTAMLESRHLVGNEALFSDFVEKYRSAFLGQRGKAMAGEIVSRMHARRREQGRFVQILEPDIKEATGGLRDIHALQWVLKARRGSTRLEALLEHRLISKTDFRSLEESLEFLWRVRNDLHFRKKKKLDRLEFVVQSDVAASLKFEDTALALGVEHFMRQYYLSARRIEFITDSVCHELTNHIPRHVRAADMVRRRVLGDGSYLVRGKILLPSRWKDFFSDDPSRLMSIFRQVQVFDASLSRTAIRAIRANLHLVDDGFRRNRKNSEIFMEILGDTQQLTDILRIMHRVGLLGAYLPEFGRLTGLVQHDYYHAYTADEHTLYAVEKACDLAESTEEQSLPRIVLQEIPRRAILHLSLLLHDSGKSGGPGHAARGAEMSLEATERLGLPQAQRDVISTVIAYHLELSNVSQRRDLEDPAQIEQVAQMVPDIDTARLLYVHTWCDMQATGPHAISEWKMVLLDNLYTSLYSNLTSSDSGRDKGDNRPQFLAKLSEIVGDEEAIQHLGGMPLRYMLSHTPEQAAEHAALARRLGNQEAAREVAIEFKRGDRMVQVTVCAKDRPGLLTAICGVLASHDLNIFRADAFTRGDGVVVDLFEVSGGDERATLADPNVKKIEKTLAAVLRGEESVEELIERHSRRWARRMKAPYQGQVRVVVDNNISEIFTVVDVFAGDRVGLLYEISHVLLEVGVDIHLARIGTDADRAADAFYITELGGQKITDMDRMESIRTSLLETLA